MSRRQPSPSDGAPTDLRYVIWEITLRCDQACGHCGSRAGKPRERELSTDEALDVVRQLADMGTAEVVLIGGEAYLREDWTQIARGVVDAGMRCVMVTGGRGLDRERALRAADAGMSAISVSIDGIEDTHDLQRGPRSFEAARRALGHVREAGVDLLANTQVNRLSFPQLDDVYELLRDHGAEAWQLQLTVPMGRAAERPHWLLQPYELLEVFPKLAELAERGAVDKPRLFAGNNVGYFGPHELTIRGGGARQDTVWGGCVAGKSALGIEADGSIKGCPSLPSHPWVGGNIRMSSIRSIWDGAAPLRYTRDRDTTALHGFCAGCYYADECRGGCTWTAQTFLGRPGDNPLCYHRALQHRKLGLRERLVQVEVAPGKPFDHGRFELVVEPWAQPEPIAPPTSRALRVLP